MTTEELEAIQQAQKIIDEIPLPLVLGIIHFRDKNITREEEIRILHALQREFPHGEFEIKRSSPQGHMEPDGRDYISMKTAGTHGQKRFKHE